MMPQTSISQKILLLLFGFFLTLVILEVILRLGAAVFNARQDAANRFTADRSEVRILCLGESTTALGFEDSYPSQLEQVLQADYPQKRIKVINRGMVSKTSWDILERLERDLAQYRPQIVVGMIGVNDTDGTPSFAARSSAIPWFKELRVVHLFTLLSQHLAHKLREVSGKERSALQVSKGPVGTPPGQGISENNYEHVSDQLSAVERALPGLMAEYDKRDEEGKKELLSEIKTLQIWRVNAYRYLAAYFHARGKDQIALDALSVAARLAKDEPSICYEMSRILRALGKDQVAAAYIIKAMKADHEEPYFFMEGGRVFEALHNKDLAYQAFHHAMDVARDNTWFYTEAGRWFRDNGYVDEAYLVFKKALSFDNSDPAILEDLASVLAMRGQNDAAARLRNDAAAIRGRKGYRPATFANYNEIVRRVLGHGAVMVAMQYPLRDVRPLRDMLRDREKVIFVENRTNFQKVLQNGEDSRYFADYFASDFGHCKAAGNLLIAKSLADVLEKKVLPNL